MLPAMPPSRRVTPLAGWSVVAAFVLIGIALLATVWSTRAVVIDATDAVQRGQALAMQQTVRADLADLEGPPTPEDLARMVQEHADEGLRYLALVEGRSRIVYEAGTPMGTAAGASEPLGRTPRFEEVGGRVRLQTRPLRQLRGGSRNWRVIIELEPLQASALREAVSLTLGIGALAAASLLGVAIVLVRRESRRNAEERAREHERRLASLGEMSAVLAHEIKNPLASLKGNAQLLAQMLAKALPEGDKPRSKAARVVDEAVRLEQLTNNLLRFVRTGAIERTSVDQAAIVREAATSVSPEVELETGDAPATWSLDPARIREVVVNLVDNAVAAGPPVRVRVATADRRLVIEVADHGPGIPEDAREKIFEPFFTGKTQGTGLGLALVRRVIDLHGGNISIQPNPGGGALFRVELPEA